MRFVSILVAVALALPGCTFNFNEAPQTPAASSGPPPDEQGAPAPAADESEMVQRFFGAGWRYCDAVVLSGIWGGDAWEAKVRAGRKLGAIGAADVRGIVDSAREAARKGTGRACAFHETGYGYADAKALAEAWGTTVGEAKGRVETKVLWGGYDVIDQTIADAKRGGGGGGEQGPDARAKQAFFDSGAVDYCHAKMLSAAWSNTVSQSKVILGHKVMTGNTELLESTLGEARAHARANPAARCDFVDTSFTHSDAVRLGELWDLSTAEAKATLTDKYLYGSEAGARAFLASLQPGH